MRLSAFITLLLCCYSLVAKSVYVTSGDDPMPPSIPSQGKILLTFTPNDYKDRFPIKRTPATYSFLPQAWIDGQSLYLLGVVSIENLCYDIIDAEERPLLSGSVDVGKGLAHAIPLASLPAGGDYTLLLTIGEDSFAADFKQ